MPPQERSHDVGIQRENVRYNSRLRVADLVVTSNKKENTYDKG
jgi:hypothetical protein